MSSCSATIELENPGPYTNLDIVRGKVHVELRSETSVKNITVKMEGVSKSIVPIQEEGRRAKDSKNDAIEVHKLLYKTLTVFPPQDVQQNSSSNQYTLPAGSYTYDFQFKIPLQIACSRSGSSQGGLIGQVMFNAGGLDFARSATGHVDSLLPPSLSGFGDNATIKYFIKATINRASMFKMNTRSHNPFVLLPMDVPLIDEGKLAFVRREVNVATQGQVQGQEQYQGRGKGKGKLGMLLSRRFLSDALGVNNNNMQGPTASFALEARYPKTGAIQAVTDLPIKLYLLTICPPGEAPVKQLIMKDLKISLYAKTEIRAQQHTRDMEMGVDLCNKQDINAPINLSQVQQSQARHGPTGNAYYETLIDPEVYKRCQVPDYVPPTFTACNINRTYKLAIEASFYAGNSHEPQYATLVIDVIVRSGIAIPQQKDSSAPMVAPQPTHPPNEKAQYEEPAPQYPNAKAAEAAAEYAEQDTQGDALPSYDDAVGTSSAAGSSSAAPPPPPPRPQNETPPPISQRRQFGQSADYFKNIDQYD